MIRRQSLSWGTALALALSLAPNLAGAAEKVAIFPFDMSFPKSEDEFFLGGQKPSKEEEQRLAMAYTELTKLVAADKNYEVVDLASLSKEITDAQPIYNCNGCEIDIANKAKAQLSMTSVVDKISETHLSLTVALVDVAKSTLVRNASVLIQGNTDESWLHGVRWLAKNRLLTEDKPQ